MQNELYNWAKPARVYADRKLRQEQKHKEKEQENRKHRKHSK